MTENETSDEHDPAEERCQIELGSSPSSDGTENGLEMVLCGGCDKYSLLADAENAARDEERPIDEPHCPRCGTRVDYDGTTVRDFVPRSETLELTRRRW